MADYFTCPHCGARVPMKALSCPECGSDEQTGWSDRADYAHLLYHDEDDAYEKAPEGTAVPWRNFLIPAIAALTLSALLAVTLRPWGIYLIPLVLAAIIFFTYRTQFYPTTDRGREKQLHRRLLQQARGDEALVERLVNYERKRNPGAPRGQLLADAIYRWERDRR